MKLIIVACLFVAAHAFDCSEGQSVWCSSIEAAEECDAMNHCKGVWKTIELSEDPSDVCTFCESIMNDVVKFLQEEKEQEEIKKYMEAACTLIPIASIQEECNNVVENDLPILLMLIAEELEPSLICGLMGMCKSNDLFKLPVVEKPVQSPVQANGDICTDCKAFFGDIKDEITAQTTVDQLEQMINNLFCNNLGGLAEECKQLVDQYVPILLQMIADEYDPAVDCQVLGFCSMTDFVRSIMPQLKLKAKLHSKATGDICTDCKAFFGDIKDEITSQTTADELEQMINNVFCNNLGALADECKQLVAEYVPDLLQMFSDEYDPAVDCQVLGFCSMTDAVRSIIPQLRLKKSQLYSKLKGNDEYCDACKEVVTELKNLDQDPSIQAEIEQYIDQYLCSQLGTYEDLCKTEVKAFLPEILQLLASELDPEQDCEAIGFCSADEYPLIDVTYSKINDNDIKAMQQSGPKMTKVDASIQCVLCEFVMNKLDSMLTQNATEQEIIKALDTVCSILPSSIASECQDFINTYGPAVLTLLAQEIAPDQICATLGLCSSNFVDATSDELCLVCETLIQYLDSILSENATEKEIEAALDKVCNFLPDSFKSECVDLVNQYEPMLIQLLEQELTPKQVCTELKVCTAMEKIIVPQKQNKLGEEECSWGPAYWCASKENAAKCRAEAHCMKHVWN